MEQNGRPGLYCKSVSPTNRNVSYHYYDALNREVCVAGTRFDGTLSYTATNYDRYGRVKSESLPYLKGKSPDKWTEYTYDDYDRVIKVTSPSGAYVSRSYNKLSETVEENQIATTTVYDAMGRTLSVTDPSGKVTYSLRADGQPDKITAPGGAETLFEYDTAGRLTLRHDPSEGNTSFTYDSGGNTSSVTDARGKTISYEYDIHDRPTARPALPHAYARNDGDRHIRPIHRLPDTQRVLQRPQSVDDLRQPRTCHKVGRGLRRRVAGGRPA